MIRILIVDDHLVVRRGLIQILEHAFPKSKCGEAGDTAEALEQISAAPWDVVILDINLPGRSGLDVLTDIRKRHPNLPVLVLSIYPEDQYAVRVLKAGADGYLEKDAAAAVLAEAVRKVLDGGKYVSPSLAEKLASSLGSDGQQLPHETLSDREYEVMRFIASGMTVTEIAKKLSLSVKTISTYRTRMLEKTGLKTNADMARYAAEHDLLD